MSSGSIGAALRRSQSRKAASAASPTRPATRIGGEVQPRTGPAVSADTTPARPMAAGAAPGESRRPVAPGSRDSGTWRSDTHTTTAARGRLMRKMSRQVAAWTTQPPRNRPMAAGTQPGPGADGRSAALAPEAGLDDGQAARGEQRSADALEGAGGDQRLVAGGEAAQQGGRREPDHPEDEHPAPAVVLAERDADQQEIRQGVGSRADHALVSG